ncbi:MAG: ABC transporter substrate-binding protein [Flavobacteriaceae bacterium]
MIFKDQTNRKIYLKTPPKRIVSLVPSQTELLCYLGLEASLVGVTKFCVHPKHIAKEAVVVGGTKQIHLDKIKALQPDIILCNKEENTKEIVESCETICTTHVSDIFTIDDSLQLIKQYGKIFNVEASATKLIAGISAENENFKTFIAEKPILKVAYFIWKDPYMVAGNENFINHMLQLNGFKNSCGNKSRYPKISLDEIEEDVEIIMLSSEPYPFGPKHKKTFETHFPNAKILLVDGEMFSWYGPRLLQAFEYFKTLRLALPNIPIN